MRSVPSFIGEFKRRDKGRGISTVKQELPIEREATVRQLKKQILQRLKNESLTDEAESKDIDSGVDTDTITANVAVNEVKQGFGKTNWNAGNLVLAEKSPQGRRQDLHLPFVDSPVELNTAEKEVPDLLERRKKPSTGERGKTPLQAETQNELYVPSFISQLPTTAERRRKTDDIKQKAAERRRLIENERHSSSPNVNILVNDTPVANVGSRHVSTPSLGRRSGSAMAIDIDDMTKGGRRDAGTNNGFLAVTPRLPRSSSLPSVYEAAPTFGEEAHFKDFARKKQDKLEEDLRRVEDCLNQTFIGLKKYRLKTN